MGGVCVKKNLMYDQSVGGISNDMVLDFGDEGMKKGNKVALHDFDQQNWRTHILTLTIFY